MEIVIPVYNEERDLPRSVARLRESLRGFPYPWRILIADNGSTDRTLAIAQRLAQEHPSEVAYIHLPVKGRGRALKKAWLESPAEVLTFMDVDLSTDLQHFRPLVEAIAQEGYDLAIGSRLARGAQTTRSLKREVLSRGYNLLIRLLFPVRFTDAQCGFKALSRRAAHALLPLVKDDYFFLDTELLLIAERAGFRIKEIPVRWVEDPDSRVNIPRTIVQDVRGLLRLRFKGIPRPFREK